MIFIEKFLKNTNEFKLDFEELENFQNKSYFISLLKKDN